MPWNRAFTKRQLRQPVICLHIPKAAGTTLLTVMRRMYASQPICELYSGGDTLQKFALLPAEEREQVGLVMGHAEFGIHRHLPHPATYVTVLRNPIDRLISHYYYCLRQPNHYLHQQVVSRGMSLDEYVSSGFSVEFDNWQTRALAGASGVAIGACSRQVLTQAMVNMRDHFRVVGICEQFDKTLLLMKKRLRWKAWPFYQRYNVTEDRPRLAEIPHRTMRLIERHNELDCELYEHASRQFALALQESGIGDAKERRFNARNRRANETLSQPRRRGVWRAVASLTGRAQLQEAGQGKAA